eukprot:g52251.t1
MCSKCLGSSFMFLVVLQRASVIFRRNFRNFIKSAHQRTSVQASERKKIGCRTTSQRSNMRSLTIRQRKKKSQTPQLRSN